MNDNSRVENVIIIGGASAGYTAATYTARAELEPLVIEGFQWGGQLQNTTDVENYPGFPEGIMGPELMQKFREQAERFGTRFITDDATRIELSDGGIQTVWVGDDEYRARSIILAMGAEPKRLGIPGEMELGGKGVSTCGVCDGAFFKGENVAVIGGGDSAMEDSIFVSKFADDLTIVHRRPEFRASKIMEERARDRDNITIKTPYVPEEFIAGGDGKLAKIRLKQAETGETEDLEVGGAFSRASSPSATSWTTPIARPSRRQARARWAPWTPSGTCATSRPRPKPTGRAWPARRSRRRTTPKSAPRSARSSHPAIAWAWSAPQGHVGQQPGPPRIVDGWI